MIHTPQGDQKRRVFVCLSGCPLRFRTQSLCARFRGASRKKYLGGLVPHHLGGKQQRLSEITIEPITSNVEKLGLNYPEKSWGPGQDLGGVCPPGLT